MKKPGPAPEELAQENKKFRMLKFTVDFALPLIYQSDMPRGEALLHFTKARRFALMFSDKELAFKRLYVPSLNAL